MASKCILVNQELTNYLIFALPIYLVELLAAIAGSLYLKKVPTHNISTKHFVWFLWFTVTVEAIGTYAPIAYFEGFHFFAFLKGTVIEDSEWIYNIYSLINASFFIYYFRFLIKNELWRAVLKYLLVFFIITSILKLALGNEFFNEESKYVNLGGTFLVFFSIVLFYFELLKSDMLLNLKRYLPLYISIGVLVFLLCMTPLSIFTEYFNQKNSSFVKFRSHFYLYSNLFLYTLFILGFYICSRKTKYS